MARKARIKSMSGIYHIVIRGVNRQFIFDNNSEKQKMLEILSRYKINSEFDILGYCFMSNHLHLLLKEGAGDISKAMKLICSSYAYWYNTKYNRIGHLFQERFRSEAVEDDAYLFTVIRYIHLNPIKAGIEINLMKYKWSSYSDYIRERKLVSIDYILDIFSKDRSKAVVLFNNYMHETNNDVCLEDDIVFRMTDTELNKIFIDMYGFKPELFYLKQRQQQNTIIKEIKSLNGVTFRQLSRFLGISKSMIEKA